ncbi:MAG: lipopolysaccharide heptosyltransferase I [Acidobacteriia bacterium]|nr:lipopolysaccharide heptosyltransferase I [Terriglobia bacterium]
MKILIVKLGSIGDVVHALPAVAALRRHFPEAHLDWVVERSARPILDYFRPVDRIIEIDTLKWRRSLGSRQTWLEISDRLKIFRAEHYDLVFDFQGLWKSAFVGWLAQGTRLIGAEPERMRESIAAVFYSQRIQIPPRRENVVFEHLRLVDCFLRDPSALESKSGEPSGDDFEVDFDRLYSPEEEAWAGSELRRRKLREFIILNPGANWKSKLWPVENYVLLARKIRDESSYQVVVTVGPDEQELAADISGRLPAGAVEIISTTLNRLAALAARAQLFVGPDTGPFHIAVAVGTPVVGLFAPTDPVRNGSYRMQDIMIHQNRCGEFCHRRDCGARRCITAIPVDHVWEALCSRLKSAGSKQASGNPKEPAFSPPRYE